MSITYRGAKSCAPLDHGKTAHNRSWSRAGSTVATPARSHSTALGPILRNPARGARRAPPRRARLRPRHASAAPQAADLPHVGAKVGIPEPTEPGQLGQGRTAATAWAGRFLTANICSGVGAGRTGNTRKWRAPVVEAAKDTVLFCSTPMSWRESAQPARVEDLGG